MLLVNVVLLNNMMNLQNLYEFIKIKDYCSRCSIKSIWWSRTSNEKEIKNFCETNFNITFPMTSKYDVKGNNAHPIYLWAKETLWKSTVPKWNFHKILINKEGKIQNTFASFTNPMSNKIRKEIDKILK